MYRAVEVRVRPEIFSRGLVGGVGDKSWEGGRGSCVRSR